MEIIRNTKIKITNENTNVLKDSEIFVFGSNLAGIHGAGAALLAKNNFGAVIGVGEGLTGQCYALPTKDNNIQTLPINDVYKSIEVLLEVVRNSEKFFIITAVGCGLAGYEAKDIAPMFEPFVYLKNVSLPQSFVDVIFPPKIIGYKVTDENMKCRDVQFTMNKKHSVKGNIVICKNGFHFCKELKDCFNYYNFNPENRVFLVEGEGDYDFKDDKIAVRDIKFVKELDWHEVLDKVNTGKNNTGLNNSGSRNSGSDNSGSDNSGSRNRGDYNSGNYNSGNYNSGSDNSGSDNSGSDNSGNYNSGDYNSGDYNSGNYNSGSRNSGSDNSGNCNSGDYNSGNCNSGDYNSGDYNSGNYNSGNCNSGDYNSGDYNSGIFNIDEPTLRMFGKSTKIKASEFTIPYINLPITEWIYGSAMTEQEKKENPGFYVSDGYLKTNNYKTAWGIAWENATGAKKQEFLTLPNFDAKVFEEITGIDLKEKIN
jgi:hypothetical protein